MLVAHLVMRQRTLAVRHAWGFCLEVLQKGVVSGTEVKVRIVIDEPDTDVAKHSFELRRLNYT